MTFGDADNNGIVENSDIKQINSYYPFGQNMEGPGFGAQGANKYGYNSKELNSDFGLNWNDYGARFYDASIGRFPAVDPLADAYAFQSPFAYAANNPVKYIDFMGMGPAGADNQTNEQWMSSSNPANNGSQAASTAYNGSRNAEATYGRMKAESEYAATHDGARRPVTDDDVEASGTAGNIIWEGYYTSTKNVITGFHFECGCPNPPCPNTPTVFTSATDNYYPHLLGPGLILAGYPFDFLKPYGYLGSKSGSSFASITFRTITPKSWTLRPVANKVLGRTAGRAAIGVIGTNSAGALFGRLVPGIGWGLFAIDIYRNRAEINDLIQSQKELNERYKNDLLWHIH